ncbi:MAG: hypothetical protein IKX80_09750 [Lachnospiraceae bacterium]|nr:hypothetical protein [Lachnospiraceae bacterium]MBR5733715.1 hypothetical protein [Lachnospiraceae bacterium]
MKEMKRLFADNKGVTSIEIVLILVVIIALVVIFKDQIAAIVEKAFQSITANTDAIIN